MLIPVILQNKSDSAATETTVKRLRSSLDEVGTDVLVGGNTATALDVLDQSTQDRNTIIPIILLVIFVALGIDYTIFLMTRVREEAVKHGTRPRILRGLRSTGGVITSAGVVLAATFSR